MKSAPEHLSFCGAQSREDATVGQKTLVRHCTVTREFAFGSVNQSVSQSVVSDSL